MFYRVLIVSSLCGFAIAATMSTRNSDCSYVKEIFSLRNISHHVPERPVNVSGVCGDGPSCCTSEMQAELQQSVTKDLYGLLHHNFQSVHGMFASTATNIKDEFRRLCLQSQNKTMNMLSEVYKKMWSQVKEPISDLYTSLLNYVLVEKPQSDGHDEAPVEKIVYNFYGRMFPVVYHQAIHHLDLKDFSDEYKNCLRNNMDTIQPFSNYPRGVAETVARTFKATKVLLEALSLGIDVLTTTDRLMSDRKENTEACREALLRLYYCPKCLGLPPKVKPCNGYCLNVMRGCLTQQRTTELDLPWSNFVMETQNLMKEMKRDLNIDTVLSSLGVKISDAIMYATMEGPVIEKKAKKVCGAPKLTEKAVDYSETSDNISEPVTVSSDDKNRSSELWNEMDKFVQTVDRTKVTGFYANLAEVLCSDDSFAETRDTAECWNGHRVGEYMKALVKQGLDSQKYNPELKWNPSPPEPSIERLSEKLRQMRMVVANRRSGRRFAPESDSLVREHGSGSGDGSSYPVDEDDDDPSSYDYNGSGSGDGQSRRIFVGERHPDIVHVRKADEAIVITPDSATSLSSCMSTLILVTALRWLT